MLQYQYSYEIRLTINNLMGSCCLASSQQAVIPVSLDKFEANQSSLQARPQKDNLLINSHSSQIGSQALNFHLHKKPIMRINSAGKQVLSNFAIGEQLVEMLNDVSYTESQAKDLCKALINAVNILQNSQDSSERKAVQELFNQENMQLIKNGELYYNAMLDKLQNKLKLHPKPNNKQKLTVSQYSQSRIYHTIANLKKQPKLQRKYQNQFEIKCIQSNDYDELTRQELEQIVKCESIADKVREIGENIGFKYKSIKDQSQKISNLLTKCLQNHMNSIKQLKYDLSIQQVMKMAAVSRQACIYYDNGVYILLVYFVQASKRLQQQSKSPQEIEKLLQRAIDVIYQEYPPAKGLSSQHVELISKLKELQTNGYTKVNFKHETIALKCQDKDKQEQVEKIIAHYAQVAEQCKDSFEELVKATCLEKGVYFKIGLKYYTKKPNQKAMTRIKEKMYFKKDSTAEKKMTEDSIKAVLEREQLEYKTQIDRILSEKETVQFKISDMVRGKCVFLQVGDIIHTVNLIKKFVANNPQFGIAQIESRFTNPTPISDVTLKIVLDNKIVAELQLTIQTNAAAYAFSHKIYELQRTKVFSKLKIIHNYFEESKQEFNQLMLKDLTLLLMKNNISPYISKDISQYFKLDNQFQPFENIFFDFIEESKIQVRKLQISVDPLLQDLISVAFSLAIGKWGKDIGEIINKTLKKEQLSSKIKSVALSIFLQRLSLPKQTQNMQQIGVLSDQLKKKIYMQEFLRQFFSVEQVLKYAKQNQRLFHRALQLQQVIFYKEFQSFPIELKQTIFVNNLIIEEHAFQKVKQLQEIFNFYFLIRKENNQIYPIFVSYFRWLQNQIKLTKDRKSLQLNHEINIIEAQYLIQNKKEKQAEKQLLNSLRFFKENQDQERVMDCQILLAECRIKQLEGSVQQHNKYYQKNVVQKANIMGLELKGTLYSNSLQRIQQKQWNQCKDKSDYKKLLQTFTVRALEQMSRSKGRQFIYAIMKRWPEYEKHKLQKPQIKQNDKIKYAKLKGVGPLGCEHLSKADWKNINALDLDMNHIKPLGCEHLSKGNWRNLTTLYLSSNNVGDEGCEQLIKANWKNITQLHLNSNKIGPLGCEHLSKADWKNLTTLNLWDNNIGDVGCEHLSNTDWKNLTTLNLYMNSIRDIGCKHLSQADWKNITYLYLNSNKIGPLGCQYLSKAEWKNLAVLNLWDNNVGDLGCEHLSKADWKNITSLYLDSNRIGNTGCEYLSKADWKKIEYLSLVTNQIINRKIVEQLFSQENLTIDF